MPDWNIASMWVVWENSQFDASKSLSFFVSLPHPQVTLRTRPHAQYVIIRIFVQGSAFRGLDGAKIMTP